MVIVDQNSSCKTIFSDKFTSCIYNILLKNNK